MARYDIKNRFSGNDTANINVYVSIAYIPSMIQLILILEKQYLSILTVGFSL